MALQFYLNLDLSDADDNNKLITYYNEIYPEILEDFIQLITKDHDQMDHIYRYVTKRSHIRCDVTNCVLERRRNKVRNINNTIINFSQSEEDDDAHLYFIHDLFDGIHCYLLHPYDFGARIRGDKQLSTRSHLRSKSTKYNIILAHGDESTDLTFYDSLHMFWCTIQQSDQIANISSLKQFLSDQEYDSEALMEDIGQDMNDKCNIYQHAGNSTYATLIDFVYKYRLSAHSFSTGIIFYYWDYHKHYKKNKQIEAEDEWNVNDHGGYRTTDLYIQARYASLKQEITQNTLCPLSQALYRESHIKVLQYMHQPFVKSIRADVWGDIEPKLHYGLGKDDPFTKQHLLAVVLYTDRSDLCSAFGNTFRKLNFFEELQSIKERNSQFAIWSRLLREAVQYFGHSGRGEWDPAHIDTANAQKYKVLKGPFFCGLGKVMVIPQFNIRLCGPTSTSRHREIAAQFSGEDGMILELNNDGDQRCDRIHAFDCSWISKFHQEDEWLFMGGSERIQIHRICVTRTNARYDMKQLFLFDCLLNGTCF
eukprot:805958_1